MKTFSRVILMVVTLMITMFAQAQTDDTNPYTICAGVTEPFRVDYTENGGQGTTGSTYAWSITTAGFTGTINTNQGPSGSSNHITIDWGTTPPGTYTLQVIETSADGCAGNPVTLDVTVTPGALADAGSDETICAGSTFDLSAATTAASSSNNAGVTWTTSGTGTFSNATAINPVYTPSAADETAGTVTLTLTATGNGSCPNVTDNMTLTITPAPVANAGSDEAICAGSTFDLSTATTAASSSNNAGVTWTTSGTGTFSNANAINPVYTPSAADIAGGSVTLTLTATGNGSCAADSDDMTLTITPAPVADAGSDEAICAGSTFDLSTATTAASSSNNAGVTWTTSGTGTFSNATAINPVYTPSAADIAGGTVTLTLTATANGSCTDATDNMTLTITPAPVANAGSDETICEGSTFDLSTATTAASSSNNAGVTWTTSGTGTFSNANAINPVYTPSAADIAGGSVTLTLTATGNGSCAADSDDMTLTITPAPVANAGSDEAICEGSTFDLSTATTAASATNNAGVTWTTSGTGTFSNANAITPVYTPSAADIAGGSVTLTLTATGNGSCAADSDDMTLTITPAPIANAGSDETICSTGTLDLSASTTVPSASNNGLLTWTSSGTGTFSNGNTLQPVYTPSAADITAGTVTLTLTAAGNGSCADATDNMTLTITPAPVANAGSDETICASSTFDLSTATTTASATNNAGVTWSTSGTGIFSNANAINPVYTPSAADIAGGSVTLTLTATGNGSCADDTDTMVLTFTPAATANAGSDETICEGETVDLSSSATAPTASNNAGLTWTTNGDGTFNNANSLTPIYTPGPNDIANGTVTLTLTATGNGSCSDAVDTMVVTINAKPTTSNIFHN